MTETGSSLLSEEVYQEYDDAVLNYVDDELWLRSHYHQRRIYMHEDIGLKWADVDNIMRKTPGHVPPPSVYSHALD